VASSDSRLELVTVTGVSCEPDLRHATVLLASLPEPARTALGEARPRLQAAVAHQVRLKRTPLLSFEADPAVAQGERVEEILRAIHSAERAGSGAPDGTGGRGSGVLAGEDPEMGDGGDALGPGTARDVEAGGGAGGGGGRGPRA
jgi:ribosome-binding factor A